MIANAIGLTTDSFESIYVTGGAEVAEVYGGINYADPIFYKMQAMTGTAPLVFDAYPGSLKSYTISGNTVQNGTPTPEAPVDVVGCGVRTGNLFDSAVYELVPVSTTAQRKGTNLGVLPQGTYTFTAVSATSATSIYRTIKNGDTYMFDPIRSLPYTFTADGVSEQMIRTSGTEGNSWADVGYSNIMLNLGSTALPYEPYGCKIPFTVNGTEYPIYLGQVPTTRRIKKLVFDGTEEWQIYGSAPNTYRLSISNIQSIGNPAICSHFVNSPISEITSGGFTVGTTWIYICYADVADLAGFKSYLAAQYAAGTPVTIWYVLSYATTGTVNEPLMKIGDYADTITMSQAGETILTITGSNTLSVGTTVQPSSVSITGHIKPTTS